MRTRHRIHIGDARSMTEVPGAAVELVVTSPPYPMIEMWDDLFASQSGDVRAALERSDGVAAFEAMHRVLDLVWRELARVLVDGGIACINVGDATRTLDGRFALYPNHSRVLRAFLDLGFVALPPVLWRKPTNAPNKFMGSGMLPPGAYVTLEHEHVLIFRKGGRRHFPSAAEKANRRESAYFWEERNQWFSDVWSDLNPVKQALSLRALDREERTRSAAFPFELPYRLVHMFSAKGDTVLDPFLGLGTTAAAAMASGRNSIGYELDDTLPRALGDDLGRVVETGRERVAARIRAHGEFVRARHASSGPFGYRNEHYGFPVVTQQETRLLLAEPTRARRADDGSFEVTYSSAPDPELIADWDWFFEERAPVVS